MNLKRIQDILSSPYDNDAKEYYILKEIAKDENAIPMVLELLNQEREVKKELIQDMNVELSRAELLIDNPKIGVPKTKGQTFREFVLEEIKKFYEKYQGYVGHCFKDYNKEK